MVHDRQRQASHCREESAGCHSWHYRCAQRYRGCVLDRLGARVAPLTPGKWLTAVSIPLLGGWIAAAATTRTDVFGLLFWLLTYTLAWGIVLSVWGALTAPISLEGTTPDQRLGAVVLEELALAAASFFLFQALIAQ
jgi:hypothetical protein